MVKGQDKKAISISPKPSLLAPIFADAFYARGNAYNHWGSMRSHRRYSSVIALNPGNTDAYSDRGDTHLKRGAYNEALADFTQALERDARV